MQSRLAYICLIPIFILVTPIFAEEIDQEIPDLQDNNGTANGEAMAIIGENDTQTFDSLIETLSDNRSAVRAASALALGVMNNSNAVDPLILALNDTDKIVRKSAA